MYPFEIFILEFKVTQKSHLLTVKGQILCCRTTLVRLLFGNNLMGHLSKHGNKQNYINITKRKQNKWTSNRL